MVKLIITLAGCLLFSPAGAQEQPQEAEAPVDAATQAPADEPGQSDGIRKIAAKNAKLHAGETLAVCGIVASGVYNRRSQTKNTYLNFDKPYPDNTFTAVIKRKNRKYFDYKPEALEGQFICVYGMVVLYRGNPEINVVMPEQIATANPVK
jgi:DNA/RNA endonuclease YhcR with UshA esterase domain